MTAWQRAYARSSFWFLLPALLLLGLFVVWPLVSALYFSLHDADLLRMDHLRWSSLANYSDLLGDPRFRRAFANTALFAVMVVPVQATVAFLLALWVTRPHPAWRFLYGVFFLPSVVAMPVLAVLWSLIYQPAAGSEMGPLNSFLVGVGLAPQAWLHDPRLALPAIGVMSIWQGAGLQMMVFAAGLRSLPVSIFEAAKLDGASAWQRTLFITVPALKNSWVFVLSVTTILAFRLFVQPYLMTRGGPGDATLSVVQAIYEMTFVGQDLGRGCAASFLLLAWVALLTLLQRSRLSEERA
jgi:ABC-type sugar transport system permease subunit